MKIGQNAPIGLASRNKNQKTTNFKALTIKDNVYHSTLLVYNRNEELTGPAVRKVRDQLLDVAKDVDIIIGYNQASNEMPVEELYIKAKRLNRASTPMAKARYYTTFSHEDTINSNRFEDKNFPEQILEMAKRLRKQALETKRDSLVDAGIRAWKKLF